MVKNAYIFAMEEELIVFIATRPALNLSAFAREMGEDPRNFRKILEHQRKIPQAKRGHYLNQMRTYGYDKQYPPSPFYEANLGNEG